MCKVRYKNINGKNERGFYKYFFEYFISFMCGGNLFVCMFVCYGYKVFMDVRKGVGFFRIRVIDGELSRDFWRLI